MLKEDLKFITTDYLRDTKQLSVRSANCCINEGLDNFYKILSFFEEHGSFSKKKIKNAGRKTNEELDELCLNIIPTIKVKKKFNYVLLDKVLKIIKELELQEFQVLKSVVELIVNYEEDIRNKTYILTYDLNDKIFISAYSFYIRNGHFPMFWILEQHLKINISRDIKIMVSSFPIFENNKELSLSEIAEELNLSRERVRQIRNNVYRRTFEIHDSEIEHRENCNLIKYSELLKRKNDWSYILDELEDVNIITAYSFDYKSIIDKEQCGFSIEFILQIIAYVFRDTFTLFDGFDVSCKGMSNKHTYLIRRKYTDVFDFTKLKKEFENLVLNNKFEYHLDIKKYILNSTCWFKFDFDKVSSVTDIAKTILLNEQGLYSDGNDGKIKIPVSENIDISNFVYEILRLKGEPMFLDDIFTDFKKLLPDHRYTLENKQDRLRPFIQRNNKITTIKRKSLYTLHEWDHFPKGTIRDRIIEYLESEKTPQTVENITNYVNEVFKTTENSVRSSMLSGRHFVQFKNGSFGLKNLKYPSRFKKQTKLENSRRSFEQRLNDFETFIVENEHFPFSNTNNKEEVSLYRWWSRVENGKLKLSKNQLAEVKRINRVYESSNIDITTHKWMLSVNKLKRFILENQRLPSSIGNEKYLYRLWMRVKEDFFSNQLNNEQRKKYIELIKLI